MEEKFTQQEKHDALTAQINATHTQCIKKIVELEVNDTEICWFCKQKIQSIEPTEKNESLFYKFFCSKLCKTIFTSIISLYNIGNNKIEFLTFECFLPESQEKFKIYINEKRSLNFKNLFINYVTVNKICKDNEFKEIKITFEYRNRFDLLLKEDLYLTTCIFIHSCFPFPFYKAYCKEEILEKSLSETKSEIEKSLSKLSSKCLYCKDDLEKKKLLYFNLNKDCFIGGFCSYFCGMIFISINYRHISKVKVFYNFPPFEMIKNKNLDFIEKNKKEKFSSNKIIYNSNIDENKNLIKITKYIY